MYMETTEEWTCGRGQPASNPTSLQRGRQYYLVKDHVFRDRGVGVTNPNASITDSTVAPSQQRIQLVSFNSRASVG